MVCEECVTLRAWLDRLEAAHVKLLAATAELRRGDGTYYLTQERAMAPGSGDGWPETIPAPHTKNARLVKREFPKEAE